MGNIKLHGSFGGIQIARRSSLPTFPLTCIRLLFACILDCLFLGITTLLGQNNDALDAFHRQMEDLRGAQKFSEAIGLGEPAKHQL